MITLYHCVSARSLRVLWMLEEAGLPYELKMLPFPPRVLQRSYLEINPLGTVPLMIDGAVRMTESAAICQYLAGRGAGLEVEPGNADYADYLNFLHFGEATLTFPQTLVLRYRRFEPEARRQPQVADDYARWFLARARSLEQRLANREWICAPRFTAADVSVGYALRLAELVGLIDAATPAVQAYWQRLRERAGYQRALAAEQRAAVEQGISPLPATEVFPDGGAKT